MRVNFWKISWSRAHRGSRGDALEIQNHLPSIRWISRWIVVFELSEDAEGNGFTWHGNKVSKEQNSDSKFADRWIRKWFSTLFFCLIFVFLLRIMYISVEVFQHQSKIDQAETSKTNLMYHWYTWWVVRPNVFQYKTGPFQQSVRRRLFGKSNCYCQQG